MHLINMYGTSWVKRDYAGRAVGLELSEDV